jgi:hypothetical protein
MISLALVVYLPEWRLIIAVKERTHRRHEGTRHQQQFIIELSRHSHDAGETRIYSARLDLREVTLWHSQKGAQGPLADMAGAARVPKLLIDAAHVSTIPYLLGDRYGITYPAQ